MEVNDADAGQAHGVRVFAGPRWDPFIMDAPAMLKTIATGKLSFTDPGSIFLDGKNVLSVVVEIDCDAVLGDGELVGVVAETLTRGKLAVRFERAGRPEVPNLMLGPKQFDPVNRDLEIRDLYNMEDAFHLAQAYLGAYRARLNANLAFWDGLDGKTDWPPNENGAHPLTELMLADFLVVDVTKPYAEQGSFLEIELATREARRTRDLRRASAQRRRDGHDLHLVGERRKRSHDPRRCRPGNDAGVANVPLPGTAESRSSRAARAHLAIRSDHVNLATSILELDDIQSGALHPRPSPYVGTYLLLRIDDRDAGRELVRRLYPVVDSGRPSSDPSRDAWITVAFTHHGLKALGVPQESLDSFAPEFRQGMAARAAELGDVGESSPDNWEKPLGTRGRARCPGGAVARCGAAGNGARKSAPCPPRAFRRRAHLAPGLLPAPDRTHLLRLQGRDRPADSGGERNRRL